MEERQVWVSLETIARCFASNAILSCPSASPVSVTSSESSITFQEDPVHMGFQAQQYFPYFENSYSSPRELFDSMLVSKANQQTQLKSIPTDAYLCIYSIVKEGSKMQ